jgi:hypothetical protein
MRLYDVCTDTYLTDRSAIIDQLVEAATSILTFSQRGAARGRPASTHPAGAALLRKSLGDRNEAEAYRFLVPALWRAWVLSK